MSDQPAEGVDQQVPQNEGEAPAAEASLIHEPEPGADSNAAREEQSSNHVPAGGEVNMAELDEIRARMSSRQGANRAAVDSSIGGLLDEQGQDVRRLDSAVLPGEDHDDRRQSAWRGKERAGHAGMQFDFCLDTFDYKIQASILGSELRIFVVFVVWFCFFFLIGRNVSDNYYFAHAIEDPVFGSEIARLKVARFFPDISEASEFNFWVMDVFLYQTIDLTYVTGGNVFLGATRFRTQRVRKDTCTINNDIIPKSMPAQAQECYGDWTSKHGDKGVEDNPYNQVGRWNYRSCQELGQGSYITGIIARYDCGGYIFEVPWWRPIDTTDPDSIANGALLPFPSASYERMPKPIAEFQYVVPALLNDPPFIDNLATRLVVLEFYAYQPTLGTFLSIKAFAEVAPGGLWVANRQVRVFEVWTTDDLPKTILVDCVFVLFVLFYIYNFFADLLRFRRQQGKTLAFFFNLWNLMEMANLIIFLIVFGFRIAWIRESVRAKIKLDDLAYKQVYPVQLDSILDYYMFQVYLNSVNTVFTFLKILKFFRLNARLNILTRTLSESQDSIIGVLFIFLLVVTAFAMTGHGLFGLGVWKFRSIDASFSTLLQMLIGQFDYESMKNENRVLAGFFFWAYIILALFCLLNFLIGVLMEAFAEVSASRTVLPLDAILVKTWEDLKRVLTPSNIRRVIVDTCRRTTREQLMAEGIDKLRKYRELLFSPEHGDVPDEEKQMIYKADFLDGIGDELAEAIGLDYLDYVWDDLVYEWDQSNSAQEAIEARRNLEMTTKGVRIAVGKHLERVEQFSARMARLEAQLAHLVNILEQTS